MRVLKLALPATIMMMGFLLCTSATYGIPEYAKKEKKACSFCHSEAVADKAAMARNQTDAGKYYKGHNHSLDGFTAPSGRIARTIDPSKVKFLLAECAVRSDRPLPEGANFRRVNGIVAKDIDLSVDATAKQLLQMAAALAIEKCPSSTAQYDDIEVYLRPGDPASFIDARQGFGFSLRRDFVPPDVVRASSSRGNQLGWWLYQNIPGEARAQEEQRQAIQSALEARSSAFVKANGVSHFVTLEQLAPNPFAYQGQVLAIYGSFEQMNSATQSLFSSRDKAFVVSGIPTARFRQHGDKVMLAARVLGNIEIKLPVLGPTLVPHLSFVGSEFCQQPGCSEFAFNLR